MAGKGGECIAPTRFCGVGAWRVRRNSAVFIRNRDHGSEDAVDFPGIGGDGYFDYRRCNPFGLLDREFSQNTVRLRVGPAGDIVANSEKDGLNCLYSRFVFGAQNISCG